jgi:hypothetical protein
VKLGYLGLKRDTQVLKSQEKLQARALESLAPTIRPWYDSSPEDNKSKSEHEGGKNSTKLNLSKQIKKATPKQKTPKKTKSPLVTPKRQELRTPVRRTSFIKSPARVGPLSRNTNTPTYQM